MKENNSVLCPACASPTSITVRRVTSHQAAQHYIIHNCNPERHSKVKEAVEYLWKSDSCAIMRCGRCRFVFAHPFVGGDKAFYYHAYVRSSYPEDKWEYIYTISALKKLGTSLDECKILEVGAGNGAFLRKLRSEFSGFSYLGLEYSDYGAKCIEDLGYTCKAIDLLELDGEGGFDHIFMFQVLEHMDQLAARMEKLAALLQPKGQITIAVPAYDRITFNEEHKALLDMPPNHIGRFTKESFVALGDGSKLELIDFSEEPFNFLSGLKLYLTYRHLRSSQREGTLANIAESSSSSVSKRLLRVISVFHQAVLGSIYYTLASPRVGNSSVAVFRKRGRQFSN